MLESPLFPSLHHRWKDEPAMSTLTKEVQLLVTERNKGPKVCPSSEPLRNLAQALQSFRRLYDEVREPDEGGPSQFYRAYAAAICLLRPLIDAAKWPRWLLLEQSLASASRSGDLLAAALALRTQIEVLDDLLLLDTYESRLPRFTQLDSPFPVTAADCQRIRDHATLLWSRFLPMLHTPDREEMTRTPEMPPRIVPRAVDLADAFGALNDYVHPNYGSHVQAIWPEQAGAGIVLLTAFVRIYRTFLALPWTRGTSSSCVPAQAHVTDSSWCERMKFIEQTLPRLCERLRQEHGYPEEWAPDSEFLKVFRDRFSHEREEWDDLWAAWPEDSGEHFLEPLRRVLECCTRESEPLSPEEVFFFPRDRAGFGLPATPASWLSLSALRHQADTLEQTVSVLAERHAFPVAAPYDNWVEFLRTAIEFSVMVGTHKLGLMRLATMRSVNERNIIGAILCARSVMEHYAVAAWLSERFRSAWDRIEDAARSNRDLVPLLNDLESDVGRFLAGTKRTAEATTEWRSRWVAAGRDRHVNLERAIEKAYEKESPLRFLYDWFCRVIHGDRLTGSDLLEPGSERIVEKQLAKAVMVLAHFERLDVLFEPYGPVASAIGRLARSNWLQNADDLDSVRAAIRNGTIRHLTFKLGRDVFGTGSESEPYYFRADLVYYGAFYAFLEHQGIRNFTRSVWIFCGVPGDRVETEDGRVLYFWNRFPDVSACSTP